MPKPGTLRICIVAVSSDNQVLNSILQAGRLRLEAQNAFLMRDFVLSPSVAHELMAGGNNAIMNYRVLYLAWLPGPDPIRVAMIAAFSFGFNSCMVMIRPKEDVVLWARMGKGGGVFLHNLGDVLGYLTFTETSSCVGLSRSCEE